MSFLRGMCTVRIEEATEALKHSDLNKGPTESSSAGTPRTSGMISRRSTKRVNTEQVKRSVAKAGSVVTKLIPPIPGCMSKLHFPAFLHGGGAGAGEDRPVTRAAK